MWDKISKKWFPFELLCILSVFEFLESVFLALCNCQKQEFVPSVSF